jgi:hypothetical protein
MHILIWLYGWTHSSRSMVWLCNKCLQVCISCLPTYELHISLLVVAWERRHNVTLSYAKNIIYLERREKTYTINVLARIHEYHKGETWESYKGISEFYLKICKNSRIKVDQRTRDIVLDLTILSFNYSRLEWQLQAPWWKVIWVSLKVRIVHSKLKKSSCLNACVLLRRESIVATSNPSLSLSLLSDEQRVSLGELLTVDKYQF